MPLIERPRGLDVLRIVQEWEPPIRPHCSDCRHCTVLGDPDRPEVSCAAGHGPRTLDLWRMIRRFHPRGFRAAASCPDWCSMSEDDA